jgi:hypothetical protein
MQCHLWYTKVWSFPPLVEQTCTFELRMIRQVFYHCATTAGQFVPRAPLHCGKNSAKLLGFKEQKHIFLNPQPTNLARFLPYYMHGCSCLKGGEMHMQGHLWFKVFHHGKHGELRDRHAYPQFWSDEASVLQLYHCCRPCCKDHWGSVTHQMAVPVPSISCCVLNHINLLYPNRLH